jgi:hypothetical protein
MPKRGYNFEENILQLSETKELANLHEEWVYLSYNHHVDSLERCICNREIGNVHRYLNMKTKRMINVGTDCVKKLQLKNCKSVRSILTGPISGTRGNYQEICDLIKYSNENWVTFLESMKSKANSDWDNLIGLTEINKIIEFLSENAVDCSELQLIVDKIQERINQRNQLAETHRRWTENMEKKRELRIQKNIRIMQEVLCNEGYKEKIRNARLKQEEDLRIQRIQRLEKQRKIQEDLEKQLAQNVAKEKERLFMEKKRQFAKGIREQVRNEIPKCEKCNRIQRCLGCSGKITIQVNNIIQGMINSGSFTPAPSAPLGLT